jgi:uncharacterized protein (DUF1697 family)
VDATLDVVTYVAFFRNLNQGQRNSPTGAALVDAFVRLGATNVAAFQTNGTVTFNSTHPEQCVVQTIEILAAGSPWKDVAFVRSLESLAAIVDGVEIDSDVDPRRGELSFFDESVSVVDRLPITGRRCQILSGGVGFAVAMNERADESNATPTLERAIGTPVTSRGVPTLRRLLHRLGERDGSS